jgi:hypothetical protein
MNECHIANALIEHGGLVTADSYFVGWLSTSRRALDDSQFSKPAASTRTQLRAMSGLP